MVKVGRDFFGNQMDAEDVAQEALLRLWKYCERLNADRNLEALAVKVAKNVCVDLYKSRNTYEDEITSDIASPPSQSADAELHAKEVQQKIDEAIERLNPRERDLLKARQLEGKSAEEISEQTGIPKSSVKSMISTARKKLKMDLQKHLKLW
jgi:RNA polymerase sigma factor (sigma-70 family)